MQHTMENKYGGEDIKERTVFGTVRDGQIHRQSFVQTKNSIDVHLIKIKNKGELLI